MNTRPVECKKCGCDIPEERLVAVPSAQTCFWCQQKLEERGKFKRHRMQFITKFHCDDIESQELHLIRGTQ